MRLTDRSRLILAMLAVASLIAILGWAGTVDLSATLPN